MRAVSAILLLLSLTSCSSLPYDGPSARSVARGGGHPILRPAARYAMVNLDYSVGQILAAHPPAALKGLANESSSAPTDLIAEGDVLAVSVFEAGGGGLFGRSADSTQSQTGIGANQQTLPRLIVDASGDIAVPFAGSVHVVGLRPTEASDAIRDAMLGRAINPQVNVTVIESRGNSVSILGEVRTAGRFPLSAHNDRLLDVLANAGGPTKPPADLLVKISRAGFQAEVPLSVLLDDPEQNIRLAPQDQIRVVSRPRKYSTFGAFLHNGQVPIEDETVTLAAAISRAGGLDTNSANAASVMVFRFERPEVAQALGVTAPPAPKGVPVVYRLNLGQPTGMFIANTFDIQSDDLIYVARSDFTEAQKFFTLVDMITQVGYNIGVTSALVP